MYTLTALGDQSADAAIATGKVDDVAEGEKLFEAHCMSCHGTDAVGTAAGPTLVGVGAAAVDFQMSSGRMPAATYSGAQALRKPLPEWVTPEKIRQIGAYVQSLGGGPTVPTKADVSTEGADMAKGGELFRANCISCHNWVGAGGALTEGKFAPPLNEATPEQIYEAMITGPQAMPVFNDSVISPQEKRDMIAYIVGVRNQTDPGGFGLGRIGPVTEGLVAWIAGISALALAAIWITAKKRQTND
ncbi:ubiquinol-cytochrome c reductase cytochrome c subunit [Thermocatellispora tengchongensis]|uniref:Cytochrome bc1 complex cytochrome c subunit n=1 Tax=Thermocatellispora tengchongensis TaxID=1073253 RepID=A0A840PRE8_9ACTN|nr:ubiquinol-cytochrome c reductase cytochrome c subunit [Thermocatellispora tengchongensis]